MLHVVPAAVKMLHMFAVHVTDTSVLRGYRGENGANLTLSAWFKTYYFVPQGSGFSARTVGIAATEACLLKREEERFYVAQDSITGRIWNAKWDKNRIKSLLPSRCTPVKCMPTREKLYNRDFR